MNGYPIYFVEGKCIIFNFRGCFHTGFLCLMEVCLGGCTTTTNTQLAQAHMKVPIKILVMQSPITIDTDRLQTVFAPDIKPALSISEEPISQGVKHAQEHALEVMESALTKQSRLVIVTPPAEEKQFINRIQGYNFETTLSQEEADRIHASTGADALLRFGITDYGLTPKSWRNGYIAFEVTSTLAIAAVIAYTGSTATKAVAGAYLAQEAVEESAEAYAGFWALDVASRPVRIEAEFVRLSPLTTVWKTSDTGLSDVSLFRVIRKVNTDERNRQLDQATDHAVKDVVSSFSDALENIRP